jgi:diguanylate cyclase (GGDEF)-like protein
VQASVILLLAILASNVVTVWRATRLPAFPGRMEYYLMTMSGSWWAATAVFDANATEVGVKLFFSELAWYGIVTTPLFWMLFIRSYTRGSDSPQTSLNITLAVAAGLAALMIALTNQFHHMIYTSVIPDPTPNYPNQVIFNHGRVYFAIAACVYALMLATLVYTLRAAIVAPPVHRMQFLLLLLTAVVPWAANVAYNFGGLRVLGYDPTPLAFWILPITYNYTISRRKLFTVAPIALNSVYRAHPDAVLVVAPDGLVLMANPAGERLFPDEAPLVGKPFALLAARCRKDETVSIDEGDGEILRLGNKWYEYRRVPVIDGNVERACAYLLREVTAFVETQNKLCVAAKLMEERLDANLRLHEQLREMAVRDSLTGLHNRRILEDIGDRLIANADATGKPLAAVSLDLDHFKVLNDTYGHKAGDDALVMISDILIRSLRPNEVAIRMGGEEFLVLMPDIDTETAASRVEAWRAVLTTLPVATARGPVYLTFSAGVGAYPDHANDFATLLQKVDKAVYAAKNSGRDCIRLCRRSPRRVA